MVAINTITICAYSRRDYLNQVLDSLATALSLCPEFRVNHIIIGVDAGPDRVETGIRVYGLRDCTILFWPEHLGVTEHPRRLLQYAFMELDSSFNLHLEDDTVLAPDALRLVEWFRSRMSEPAHILSLHSRTTSRDRLDQALVRYRDDFGVWGWAATGYVARRYILPYWNHRRIEPLGWDYSMTDIVKRNGLIVLSPELSRVINIGREGGAHATPEQWDADLRDQVVAGTDDMRETGEFHT